jgi:hypothetical protein
MSSLQDIILPLGLIYSKIKVDIPTDGGIGSLEGL